MTYQYPPPVPPEAEQPAPKRRRWVPFVAYPGVLLLGVIIGSAGGDATPAASSLQPTVIETVEVPGPETTATAPGPTKTVTVPGPAKTVTVTPKPTGPSGSIPGDGTFLVGTDFKAGTYRATNPDGDCYWARLKNAEGDLDSIIANGNPGGPAAVTIKKTDAAFETAFCGEWKRIK